MGVAVRKTEWKVKLTRAFGLMYKAETRINPLFTDVAFCRDSEGDRSGHYESGGVMSPPIPNAICAPWRFTSLTMFEKKFSSELNSQERSGRSCECARATDAAKSKLLMSNFRINY